MKIKILLSSTSHRPWPIPKTRWKYYQEWNKALFLHWKVDSRELRPFIPDGLAIDFYKDSAWVSLVAFTMERVRPVFLPSFSPVSNFHEVNIRTYVTHNNKPGVFFLSIEAGSRISSHIARKLSELPYRYSKMVRNKNGFSSIRPDTDERLDLRYTVGGPLLRKSGLDLWLTERYALFQNTDHSLNEFEIHHMEWPVYDVRFEDARVHYPAFQTLIGNSPNITHYSPGVQVIAWDKNPHPFDNPGQAGSY